MNDPGGNRSILERKAQGESLNRGAINLEKASFFFFVAQFVDRNVSCHKKTQKKKKKKI